MITESNGKFMFGFVGNHQVFPIAWFSKATIFYTTLISSI